MSPISLLRSHLNMIMFRGKFTVSPNTLNNQIHTYFFAHRWQQKYIATKLYNQNQAAKKTIEQLKNMEKIDSIKPTPISPADFSYQRWMELIKNVSEFNRFYVECYKKAFPDKGKNINIMDFRAFRLFHDWDVWGDSTSYPQLKATAVLDTSKQDPIQVLSDDLYLTTKMGTNKCVMANMDTDSQDMSKLFAFTLSINQQLKLHLNPSVCRTLYFRTVDTLPWTTSMGVHWFASGETQLLHGNVDSCTVKWPLNLLYKRALEDQKMAQEERNLTEMRMLQYRYNHPTKVSSVVGYLMNTQDKAYEFINHNWRIVKLTSNEYCNPNPARNYNGNKNNKTSAEVFLRNIQFGTSSKGILVDISATVMDANNQNLLPVFPDTLSIKIFTASMETHQLIGEYSSTDKEEIKKLFHNKAGLLIIKDKTLPEGVPIRIQINQVVSSTIIPKPQPKPDKITIDFSGTEQSYNLEIKDHFLKTQRLPVCHKKQTEGQIDSKTVSYQMYDNFVRYELNCTQYGKPFNGKLKLNLASKFNIDPSGLTQYTRNADYLKSIQDDDDPTTFIQPPQKRIKDLIDACPTFKSTFKTYQEVNALVFQGKLEQIISMTDQFVAKLFNNNQLQYYFNENGVRKPFKLSFQANRDVADCQVQFTDGVSTVQVYLNKDLVQNINPRHPAMESLCLIGEIKICQDKKDEKKENQKKDTKDPNNKLNPNITALFFQNPSKDPFYRIDWQHVVGPKLRLMGLMYPSMQNIVNLYNYDGLSMSAMRRAFQVQDERHSRYMPATREMSSGTHRQIRRWLYNPIYDSQITVKDNISPTKKPFNLNIQDFDDGKKQLVKLLKSAFKIELTTIPLYLSAMYSISRQGEATRLIRSVAKDQMKHLFIVSNILNALGETPPYPQPNSKQNEDIPSFPIQAQNDIICFHFQKDENKEWKDLMNPLPIQSSIREQLLRFIMIEMPGQAYAIKITPLLLDPATKSYVDIKKPTCSCTSIFCNCGIVRTKSEERNYRTWLLKDAIDAVVLELKGKQEYSDPKNEFMTIGMAYEKITDYLWALNDIDPVKLFSGDNSKQFTYMYLDNMTEVINLRTALEQIRLITEEGQGSSIFTVTGETNKSSHFIKFIEIFTGCDLTIVSQFPDASSDHDSAFFKREASFVLTPNQERFPDFPNYTKVIWDPKTDSYVDGLVNSELALERLSDRLEKTQFPNTYAPRSFLNNYVKILEELGFIFTTDPKKFKSSDGLTFEETRLRGLENAVARMRQMTLNSTHVVDPNDTFDQPPKDSNRAYPKYPTPENIPFNKYPSASPKYNLEDSQWLPKPDDQPDKK